VLSRAYAQEKWCGDPRSPASAEVAAEVLHDGVGQGTHSASQPLHGWIMLPIAVHDPVYTCFLWVSAGMGCDVICCAFEMLACLRVR